MKEREIKLRQPIWEDGKLVAWHYWGYANNLYQLPTNNHRSYQYSGYKDKHGTEIYEGDLLKGSLPELVEWNKDVKTDYGHGDSNTTVYMGFRFGYYGNSESDVMYNTEIIGNILTQKK